MSKKVPFNRIYWQSGWQKPYAALYSSYAKSAGNYYSKSASALLDAAKLVGPQFIVDACCGTGALTFEVRRRYPDCRIVAIDVSDDMLEFYRHDFPKNQAIKGNVEDLKSHVAGADAVLLASSIWDLDVEGFFKGVSGIDTIAFNVPYAVLGEKRGFINYMEEEFARRGGGRYRRLNAGRIKKQMKSGGWNVRETEYSFDMRKTDIGRFFDLLKFRYPFVFFPWIQYDQAVDLVNDIFQEILAEMPSVGVREEGLIFVGRK